ncbi:hypothetical protein ZHAS_00005866 [Anopheles sinensis]|uniref:Uncharacterized protein n=1 Tax=Anopheles sinensis TaxID=74873 RepID=A0A084VKH0_ANOSI|nr:hypothetical protein ZHAS_00005866 [Anopheles sinensis]
MRIGLVCLGHTNTSPAPLDERSDAFRVPLPTADRGSEKRTAPRDEGYNGRHWRTEEWMLMEIGSQHTRYVVVKLPFPIVP